MWSPEVYLRFESERGRPFFDLLARVDVDDPRRVVDLGCGPGNLTATLAARWPRARIVGIDSSAQMLAKAQAAASTVEYRLGDVREFTPSGDEDVLVTNAVMQWVPGHEKLLTTWAQAMRSGAWLAMQVPGNQQADTHRLIRQLCAAPRWVDRLGHLTAETRTVGTPVEYARRLRAAGCAVDAWETEYVHQLPMDDGRHPVLGWISGTALLPVRDALHGDDESYRAFCAELEPMLERAYPPDHGVVDFPFRRVFCVARMQM